MLIIARVRCVIIFHFKTCMVVYRIDDKGQIKVADFGLAEDIYNTGYYKQEKGDPVRLPFKWMALESLMDGYFSQKSDVVGTILN